MRMCQIGRYVDMVAKQAQTMNPQVASCLDACKPLIVLPIQLATCCAPFYVWAYHWAYLIYTWLPKEATKALFGFALCFFGGTYVASLAAIEAFYQMGFAKVLVDAEYVRDRVGEIATQNAADDAELAKDKDGDGVVDAEQIAPAALAQRKAFVFLRAVKQPDKLQSAVGSMWAAYIAVLATLKLEFARTTAFALGIVETVKVPIVRLMSPVVVAILAAAPPDMKLDAEATVGWAITIVESALTLFAVIFAWYLQMIISAFYAGLRGGRIFGDAVCQLLVDYGLMAWVPLVAQPFVPEESYLDEFVGYSTAFCGFCFQFFSGFTLPFPLNIIFLPLTLIEWFLRIQISMTDVGVH